MAMEQTQFGLAPEPQEHSTAQLGYSKSGGPDGGDASEKTPQLTNY
jgi:hypothetical protein